MQGLFLQRQVAAIIKTSYQVATLSHTFSFKDTVCIFYQQNSSRRYDEHICHFEDQEKKALALLLSGKHFSF